MLPWDPDAFARLLYLVVLLAGVAGFFLYRRRWPLRRSLRDLVIWALIIAGVMLAYGLLSGRQPM